MAITRLMGDQAESSRDFCIIREDNNEIQAASSAFPRKVGDILERGGYKWKVITLHDNLRYAQGLIGVYGSTLFQFHKF